MKSSKKKVMGKNVRLQLEKLILESVDEFTGGVLPEGNSEEGGVNPVKIRDIGGRFLEAGDQLPSQADFKIGGHPKEKRWLKQNRK